MIEDEWKDIVYTPELLKLQEEHSKALREHSELQREQFLILRQYERELRMNGINRFITRFDIDVNDPELPEDVKNICIKTNEYDKIYRDIDEKYFNLLKYNISQLAYKMTPENSITLSINEHNTRDIISDYLSSGRFFLNLTFMHPGAYGRCGMIITQNLCRYKFYNTGYTMMSDLKYGELDWCDPSKMFYHIAKAVDDNADKKSRDYKPSAFIDDYIPTTPVALDTIYRLDGQSYRESYGRVKGFLIIGVSV